MVSGPPTLIVEETLVEALERGDDVRLSDIGLSEVLAASHRLQESPLLPEFARLAAVEAEDGAPETVASCWSLFSTLVAGLKRDTDVHEVVELITNRRPLPSAVEQHCFDTFIGLSERVGAAPTTRAFALDGSFRLAAANHQRRYRLLASLVSIDLADDPNFLRFAAKLIGVAYSLWGGDGLVERLRSLAEVEEATEEATFELGMVELADALHGTACDTSESPFADALGHFKQVLDIRQDRPDAALYASALCALAEFHSGVVPDRLTDLVEEISRHSLGLEAWHRSSDDPPWLGARFAELAVWQTLVLRLKSVALHLDEDAWYAPPLIIEQEVLSAYTASRSIFHHDRDGGIEALVAPRIEAAFSNRAKMTLLSQWIDQNPSSPMRNDAQRLAYLAASHSEDTDDPSLAAVARAPSAAVNKPTKHSTSRRAMPPIHLAVEELVALQVGCMSPAIAAIMEECNTVLGSVEDYNSIECLKLFRPILLLTLRFLVSRMDLTKANAKNVSYLFKGEVGRPREQHLQDDYHDFMIGVLGDVVSVERMDVAGGRADVCFCFSVQRIVAELKREETDASFDSIFSAYQGQATEYQNTNWRVGLLLFLDLTDKKHGTAHVREQVQARKIQRPGEKGSRGLVAVRIPGNRQRPSAVS